MLPKEKDSKAQPSAEPLQTSKKEPSATAAPEPVKQQTAPFVQRGADKPVTDRASFPVTPDGKIDWNVLKGKNKERVLVALRNDPEVARLAGKDVAEEEIFSFTEQDAREVLEFLSEGNAFAVHFVFKKKGFQIDPDILGQAFQVPSDNRLTKRGAILMNRYSNAFIRQHADLFMFFSGYMKMVKAQAQAAVIAQLTRNASQTVETPVQPQAKNGAEARQ